jgi:hypothetical protein
MGIFDSFIDNYRIGRTHGPAVLSISRFELREQGTGIIALYDLRVESWHGRALGGRIDVLDGSTDCLLRSQTYSIQPDFPCWDTTIAGAHLAVDNVPKVRCYARMSIFEGVNQVSTCASAPLLRASLLPRSPYRRKNLAAPMRKPTPEEELLGLQPGYTAGDLKSAFRRAIAEWHPDRFGASSHVLRDTAAEQTRRILEAHATLRERMGGRA